MYKANSTWLASSITCCFPTRHIDEPQGHEKTGFETEDERHEALHGHSILSREPSMPMSSMYTRPYQITTG